MKVSLLICLVFFTQLICGCSKGKVETNLPNLKLLSVNIPVNAVNVPVNTTISFTFDTPMSTNCADCIMLKQWVNNASVKTVPGVTTTSGTVLTFTPQTELSPNTRYFIEVSAAPNIDNTRYFFSDYSSHSSSSFFFTTGKALSVPGKQALYDLYR